MTFDLLPFTEEYIDAVEELEKRCFSDPFTRGMLESAVKNERITAFVAVRGDEIAGYLELYDLVDTMSVCSIETAPEFRRMGLADRMIGVAEQVARERGVPVLSLEVRVSNSAAISLYEKHGFVRAGVRRGYYEKPREDAAVYYKQIIEENET